MKPELSVVVPVFNEEEVIKATQQRLTAVLSDLQLTYEIIYINDGSTDRRLRSSDPGASPTAR